MNSVELPWPSMRRHGVSVRGQVLNRGRIHMFLEVLTAPTTKKFDLRVDRKNHAGKERQPFYVCIF